MHINEHEEFISANVNTKDGKILHYINQNSTVLEFGSGYGRMTKILKIYLGCQVYIVEIDPDAYGHAVKYAVRGVNGDISDFSWFNEFEGISFDHIIFAGILEYLPDPEKVLEKSMAFLKFDGSVLLSVSNISHSSVLIDLINNKFQYRDIGLLNSEYKRFFSQSSLLEMLENCSLVPVVEDGIKCIPENTEFRNSYNDLAGNTDILQNRKYAEVYQFVFKCIKRKYYAKNKHTNSIQKLNDSIPVLPSHLSFIYFDTGAGYNAEEFIRVQMSLLGNHFDVFIDLPQNVKNMRFHPFKGYACIVDNLKIVTDIGTIEHDYTNGVDVGGLFLFDTTDPYIFIDFKGYAVFKVKISGDIYRFDLDDIAFLSKCKWVFEKYKEVESLNKTLVIERDGLVSIRDILVSERDNLVAERNGLLNSRSWRYTKPLRLFVKTILSIKSIGIKGTVKKINAYRRKQLPSAEQNTYLKEREGNTSYHEWIRRHEPDLEGLQAQKKRIFSYRPLISIVISINDLSFIYFKEFVDSLLAQTYGNWELCLTDGSPKRNKEIKELCISDKRIRYRFVGKDEGISANINKALGLATGDYIAFIDQEDILAPFALYEFVKCINEDPDLEFIYSDEDFIIDGERCNPYFKPDFAPDSLRSGNCIMHLVVMKRILIDRLDGFRCEYDGAQDYDLVLRASEMTKKIHHIRKILYHCRYPKNSVKNPSDIPFDMRTKVLMAHMERMGLKGVVKREGTVYYPIYEIIGNPSVSIVIPNRDHTEMLKNCIDSIIEQTTYENYEIVIVENNSENVETLTYYRELEEHSIIRVICYPEKGFNYSRIINFAVQNCTSDFIVQLNNDTELITPNWLELMLGFAQRPDVGAVGAKLLYPDRSIQHGGVYMKSGEFHIIKQKILGVKNYIALVGACIMSRREVFQQIGYMDEEFAESHGDVDFCLALRDKGLLIVFNPLVEIIHYEGKTRGYDDTHEKKAFYKREWDYLRAKWPKFVLHDDPYVNAEWIN